MTRTLFITKMEIREGSLTAKYSDLLPPSPLPPPRLDKLQIVKIPWAVIEESLTINTQLQQRIFHCYAVSTRHYVFGLHDLIFPFETTVKQYIEKKNS